MKKAVQFFLTGFLLLFVLQSSFSQCELGTIIAEPHDCDANGMFLVDIDFEHGGTSDSFTVAGNGIQYGTFAYSDLFITLGPLVGDGTTVYEFVIKDLDDPNCSNWTAIDPVDCSSNCELSNLTVDLGDCNNDGTYALTLDFDTSNVAGLGFDLLANGDFFGFYSYNDLPLTIPNFPPSGNNHDWVKVCENDMPDCCVIKEFESPNCPTGCEIWDLIVEAHDCDANGNFLVDIDFNHEGTSDSFMIVGNGMNHGTFAYDDLWLTFGPLPGDGTDYEFVVIDKDDPNCGAEYQLGVVNCSGDCQVSDLVTDFQGCNNDGTYNINVTFNYQNTPNHNFDIYVNGDYFGYFENVTLPLLLENITPSGNAHDVIQVCASDNLNCCAVVEYDSPECPTGCEIWDLIVEAHDCDANGNFLVDIDFNHEGTSDSFMIVGNGMNHGTFAYDDLWLTFGPLPADGTNYEFVVIDKDDPNCGANYQLGVVDCSTDCQVHDLGADFQGCNNDGTYNINVTFNYQNTPNNNFDIYVNGDYFGYFENVTLPLLLENITPSGNAHDVIKVCASDNLDCCVVKEYDSPDCNPTGCHISEIVAEAHDCDDMGMFFVDLDFDFQNTSDSFTVVGNGNNYGTFAYSDLFITLGPFDGSNSMVYEFIIQDQNHPDCGGAAVLEFNGCSEDCIIDDLEVDVLDCNDDGTYNLILDFNYQNTDNLHFDLFANGEFLGYYLFSDLPLTIEHFPASGGMYDFIQVCENDSPTCCASIEFEAPNCGGNCLTFNDLPTNSSYGYPDLDPDDLAFTVAGVPVKVQELVYNNAIHFGSVMVYDDLGMLGTFNNADENFLYPYLTNLEFNFLQLPGAVIHLEFDFWDIGGGINIAANDATIIEANSLFDLNGTMIAPNVTLTVVPDPNHPHEGKAILDGFIGLLTIGGMDGFAMDNVCTIYDQLGDLWPGDCNYDNISNHYDLLNIGLAYGAEGALRNNASLEWIAQPADDWDDTFLDGTNFKHADTNGDGIVNADDQLAIHENFNLEHGMVVPFVPPAANNDDPPLYIDLPDPTNIPLGTPFEAPIILGSAAIPVNEIYGLAFTINFNPQIFNESEMEVLFTESWLNDGGTADQLNIQRTGDDGRISVALTRINHQNTEGFGPIASIRVIIDDLGGYTGFSLDITDVRAITVDEILLPIHTPKEFVEIPTATENPLEKGLSIYPNPASDFIMVKNENDEPVQQIRLVNTLGQEVGRFKNIVDPTTQLDISNLPSGIYFLEIKFESGLLSKKVEVFKF